MKPFDFIVPASLEEALAALDDVPGDTQAIAGGQSLLLAMKERRLTPSRLVSLSALAELHGCSDEDNGELVVGAATSYASLAATALPGWHALVPAVAGDLADRPVRTMGTIGGALCQADPRYDMLTLTVGLDARLELASLREHRTVAAAEALPADGGIRLRTGEILTAVRFPVLQHFSAAAFEKVRHRVFDAAAASAVCAISVDRDGLIDVARVTLGAVAPGPVLLSTVAEALVGRPPAGADPEGAAALATEAMESTVVLDTRQRRYQHELVAVVVQRAVTRALEQMRS